MNKRLLTMLISVVTAITIFSGESSVNVLADDNIQEIEPTVLFTVVNTETGEIENHQFSQISFNKITSELRGCDVVFNADADVVIPIPIKNEIRAGYTQGSTKEEAYVYAVLNVSYSLSGDNIKMLGINGSWTPTLQNLTFQFSNRYVNLADGVPMVYGPNIATWYPSSNSFSYSVNWPYVYRYPHEWSIGAGPSGYSEVDVSISGMGGSHKITLRVDI